LEEEYPKMSKKVCKEEHKVGYRDVYKDVEKDWKSESRNVCKDARKWAFDYKDTHENVLKNDTDWYVKLY